MDGNDTRPQPHGRGGDLLAAIRSGDPAAVGYLLGWRFVRWLPGSVARRLFNLGADLVSDRGRGMEQLRANLSRVVGPENVTRELVRASVRSYARYWSEAFRLPVLAGNPDLLGQLAPNVVGLHTLDAAVASKRGLVLVLPHTGNWDMAGLLMAQRYGRFTTVAERLRPEVLYDAFVRFRTDLGFEVLPLTGGPAPFPVLRERLESGGIVCLMGERDLRHTGVTVEFFGEPTRMPSGAVRLARETGAALHVAHSYFTPEGWGFSVSDEIDVDTDIVASVQKMADIFAANIAAYPVDWHMLQPLWLADLDTDRLRRGVVRREEEAA
ncbi:phosphatidylinositol mannoside acyltransferase [Corynebacterium pygosceleis]|uniref:Phosphatidylinositol mannoside acyltransferase n=1 Tax=Corynebacterium pygosceleis TaxID=2800406 RepID=A0A9Q4C7E1_9CORY|nr:phosphatidylinositol mannoside acyltransferase [Corynebacterium pygosceleis]MCK7636918.1 phosphatidylinositol mannoside acyltransferase [Corynebacterium pygosceleis]MCK7674392.1 phosphatidylinositol mannoside acyltransferase [Corynebacterium pygosceleis]MCL0120310.1 phosphatidylinositol mannoside acyltransferase [Corynebacterium pygosceleis]MCX7467671.1 phosphatidylinositol mannoside acyltransferase [Corynebacterium pygosceleis]